MCPSKYVYSTYLCYFQGERIRSEILALVKDVPDLLENVAEQTKNFEESVNYYQGYVVFTLETLVYIQFYYEEPSVILLLNN